MSMDLTKVFLITGIIYFIVASVAVILGFRGHG